MYILQLKSSFYTCNMMSQGSIVTSQCFKGYKETPCMSPVQYAVQKPFKNAIIHSHKTS